MKPGSLPSAAALCAMFRYDPVRGVLSWRRRPDGSRQWNARFAGKRAGCQVYRSWRVWLPGHGPRRVHRVIWKMVHDEEPEAVDHIDGNSLNNRLSNLRSATLAQNNFNRRRSPRFKAGLRGVTRCGSRWVARIGLNGRCIRLGRFNTPEAAFAAYRRAAKRYHGAFARFD